VSITNIRRLKKGQPPPKMHSLAIDKTENAWKKERKRKERKHDRQTFKAPRLQNLLELVLLCRCQTCREYDLDADDEVASFVWLLALGHAEVGVAVSEGWWCGTARADPDLLAVDGLDSS
jgi:hypothetical protein